MNSGYSHTHRLHQGRNSPERTLRRGLSALLLCEAVHGSARCQRDCRYGAGSRKEDLSKAFGGFAGEGWADNNKYDFGA